MADGVASFWGAVTYTHGWCEPNYVHSSYIAEFCNTISIAPGILLALIGLVNSLRQRFEKRFCVLHISNMILSIGSTLYHATLQQRLSAMRLAKLYVASLVVGSLYWFVDRLFCKDISRWYFNPQGHAVWHMCMGFNSYFANAFLMYCRAQQRGWDPKVDYFLGIFRYVKIQKPKAQ